MSGAGLITDQQKQALIQAAMQNKGATGVTDETEDEPSEEETS
jgi:hypothetical protein